MQALSMKIDDEILEVTQEIVKTRKISRNAYFNEAIRAYNALQRRRELAKKLHFESGLVAADSLATLKEFEVLPELYEN